MSDAPWSDVDFAAAASVTATPSEVMDVLEDLATYPSWLTIVGSASPAPAHPDDPGPAWAVEIVGRIGPLVRRKRVRMVRVDHDRAAGVVSFERHEHDGRSHNRWILTGGATSTTPTADGASVTTDVTVDLHYSGTAWIPGADLLLGQEVRRAGRRLEEYLARQPPT